MERSPLLRERLAQARDSKVFQCERQVQGVAMPVMGTRVAAPAGLDTAVVFTLLYELGHRDRRWDIVRAVRHRTP